MSGHDSTFDLLLQLSRLEDLRDEMLDLDVSSLAEIEERIRELEAQLDDVPAEANGNHDGPV